LDNEALRHAMRKRAYLFGRNMIWKEVVHRYMESFERARSELRYFAQAYLTFKQVRNKQPLELPHLNLDHLSSMTDGTGMFQHAIFNVPNFQEGYTTDDNARALLICILLEQIEDARAEDLATRYLAFILYAFNSETGNFRNFLSYQRQWLEDVGSVDCQGRALWALGVILGRSNMSALHNVAGPVFEQSMPGILNTTSPRAWAFALLGIHAYLQRFSGDSRATQVCEELAGRLLSLYHYNYTDDWRWFEDRLTY
jgi:hypothetical protein